MTVTIAHISDIHLGPITGLTPRYWNAKRAMGFINWQRKRRLSFRRYVLDRLVVDLKAQNADHIAVTGDLINIGLPQEMEAAARWLASVGPPDRVAVIPGNHDIYTSMRGDCGIARWSAHMRGDDKTIPIGEFPYVRRVGDIALIGLNSARETPLFVAAGELRAPQRARLSSILGELGREGVFRLVMIHHPPLPGQAKPGKALSDAAQLADLLARHGAELVIHGHNHRSMLAHVGAQMTPVVGVPAASMSVAHPHEPLARYHLYHIDTSLSPATIEMVSRGLDRVDGDIVELERVQLRPSDAR